MKTMVSKLELKSKGSSLPLTLNNFEQWSKVDPIFLMVEFGAKGEEVSRKTSGKTTQKTTQKILSILKENPSASKKEIAVILGDITEDGVKYQLNKMKKEKILERIGPAKGGYWKVIEKNEKV